MVNSCQETSFLSAPLLCVCPVTPPFPASESPVRSSLIRNSPAVCACVSLSPYERLYEFLSTSTTHPVSPISLKAISLLFRLPPDVWLHNTRRRDADLRLSNRRRLVCPQTGYRLVLWFFLCCGQRGGGCLAVL